MKTIDLFCGIGGLSLGFQQAGFNIVSSYDFWDKAVQVYAANFSHPVVQFDLSDDKTASKMISEYSPDIIIGGPPCQNFSSAGQRIEGEKANLTVSFSNIVSTVKPKWFVMENVERASSSVAYESARKIFKNAGYGLSENVLDASYYGVPQKRKRFFCVGKLGEQDGVIDLEEGKADRPMTVRDYFGEMDFDHYYRHPRSYARRAIFSVDEPSPTIRGVNRPISDNYVRHEGDTADPALVSPLTYNQRARIQTFPDDFKWLGSKTNIEQMVGNAVPVNLATHVAVKIRDYEKSSSKCQ